MKVRKFRILRLRHHVSMVELGRACGVSAQRISELELSENKPSAETVQKIRFKTEGDFPRYGNDAGRVVLGGDDCEVPRSVESEAGRKGGRAVGLMERVGEYEYEL